MRISVVRAKLADHVELFSSAIHIQSRWQYNIMKLSNANLKLFRLPIESQQSVCCHPHIVRFHPALRYLLGYRGRMAVHGLPLLCLMSQKMSR